MVRIIMNGCCGHMGRVISNLVEADDNAKIVAGIDPAGLEMGYPVFRTPPIARIRRIIMVGFNAGSVICRIFCILVAPSTSAASYISWLMPEIAAI